MLTSDAHDSVAQPRRVLFMGAGASFAAGYPLGGHLIDAIEEHFASTICEANAKAEWGYFIAFRETATGVAKTLLTSGNPEVVLSYIDLCVEALSSSELAIQQVQRDAVKQLNALSSGAKQTLFAQEKGSELQSLFDDLRRSPLTAATRARRGFLVGLDTYLEWRHMLDAEPGAAAGRAYIRDELEFIHDGDVVITTNYDTLAERTLLGSGRWSPGDGYGFNIPLRVGTVNDPSTGEAPPVWAIGPSRVRVLKLHGSCGWRSLEIDQGSLGSSDGSMFLDSMLLYSMRPAPPHPIVPLFDSRESCATFPLTQPVLAYPSFLKRTDGLSLAQVWEQARLALAHASEIRVLGASLPPADAAVRTLLGPVRFRLSRGEVTVSVHDMSEHARDRWREHLGESVEWVQRKAGELTIGA